LLFGFFCKHRNGRYGECHHQYLTRCHLQSPELGGRLAKIGRGVYRLTAVRRYNSKHGKTTAVPAR
jgi:hypothetical protein